MTATDVPAPKDVTPVWLNRLLHSVPPLWVLVLLALALWGGEYARRELWEPDEARYAYVAREMRAGDHWFVPHINGRLYPDKPPLMFWLINVASVLTGGEINRISTRIPSFLGSVLTLWAVTRLMARWHSVAAAWRSMLILLTTFLFWQEGGWGRIDALLCGLVLTSVYFLFTSLEGRQVQREIPAYLFAGLAVLAKGPVGLAVPLGIFAAGTWAGGKASKLKRWHWLWGSVFALVIPAVWLLVAWLQDAPSSYFAAMFGEKTFGRVIESVGHDRPFYYFLLHFPLELLPWTIFLPAAVAVPGDAKLKRTLLAWVGVVVLLFSLFVCKRNVYILAAYPAAAMLIGAAWADMNRLPRRWSTFTGGAAMAWVWLLAIAMTVAIFVRQIPINRLLFIAPVLVLIAGGVILLRLYRRERLGTRWFAAYVATLFLFQIVVSAVVMPGLNGVKGPAEAAQAVAARVPPGHPVYLYRQQLAIFPLYANRPGREIRSAEELADIVARDSAAVVVFSEREWSALQPAFAAEAAPHAFTMGHKHLVWVQFAP